MLSEQLAAASFGTDTTIISNNFNRNKERYTEGKHYFLLEGEALREFKSTNHLNDESSLRINKLYLWPEKGAWLHAKSLNTDKAWEAYEMLVDDYYAIKQSLPVSLTSIEDLIILQAQSMKEIRLKQEAQEIVQLQQAESIKLLQAKIETHPKDYFSISGYASLRGFKVDVSKANLLGRKATKLSKDYGVNTGKVTDPRFGQVNTYHLDVLKEVFSSM